MKISFRIQSSGLLFICHFQTNLFFFTLTYLLTQPGQPHDGFVCGRHMEQIPDQNINIGSDPECRDLNLVLVLFQLGFCLSLHRLLQFLDVSVDIKRNPSIKEFPAFPFHSTHPWVPLARYCNRDLKSFSRCASSGNVRNSRLCLANVCSANRRHSTCENLNEGFSVAALAKSSSSKLGNGMNRTLTS